jgi:CPA2 family monovalent cation:H+ antiporter-2
LVAESGEGHKVEHLIVPVRDMFAAVFFVSVGMMLNPALVAEHWIAMVVLVAALIIGKIVGVSVGAMLAGCGPKLSVEAGMSLAQIGEFSFIIAGLALETHAARDFLYSLAIAVSVVTTFTTPYLIKASGPIAESFERHIPRGLGVIEAIYESSVEHIRSRAASRTEAATIRWSFIVIMCATVASVALIIGAEIFLLPLAHRIQSVAKISLEYAEAAVGALTITACLIPSLALYRATRRLATALASRAVPEGAAGDQLKPPGWEALIEIMQVAMMIVIIVIALAVVQPFLQPLEGVIVLVLAIVAMGVATWRGVSRTLGQMREAARLIANALALAPAQQMPGNLKEEVIPGLGAISPLRLQPASSAIGKTIAELNLPSSTGAVVVVIGRDRDGLVVPGDDEVLRVGDVLGLAGPRHAIRAAIEMLAPPRPAQPLTSSTLR